MEMNIVINSRIRLNTFGGGKVEGRLACIERNDDDSVSAILIRTLSVSDMGSLYFTEEELMQEGWSIEDITAEPAGMEAAVVNYLN